MFDYWYVWHLKSDGTRTYGGEFTDATTALAWKSNQADGESIVINNVSPSKVVREYHDNPKAVLNDPEKAAAFKAVSERHDWKQRAAQARTAPERGKFGPVVVTKKAPKVVSRPKNADEKRLEAAAKVELDRHRKDEAAELAAESKKVKISK